METNILFTHKSIIEKCKLGDRKSQYELYNLYVDAMYNISMRFMTNVENAEDMVQNSFIDAFNNLEKFRYESTFGSWLKRIVINNCINNLKSKKIDVEPLENHEYHLNKDIGEEEKEFDIKKIKMGIERLPSGYRQIINLYLIEGYDHVEIGEILGVTTSTSKSQYHRAKKRLMNIINDL